MIMKDMYLIYKQKSKYWKCKLKDYFFFTGRGVQSKKKKSVELLYITYPSKSSTLNI